MAKNIKIYLIACLFLSTFLYGSHIEYENMVHAYEQVEQKNFATWYNIGVLYKEMGLDSKAVGAFLRAQKQANMVEFYKAAQPIFQMGSALKAYGSKFYFYVYSIPLYTYQYIFLVFLFLCIILWYRVVLYQRKKTYAYVILICLTITYTLYCIKYDWIYTSYAVILDQQVDCFAGPDMSFMVVGSVQNSQVYKVYKERNEFCQIKNNGKMCWVYNKSLEKV